ncbi:MAG TPA: hypothetical protein VFO16_10090 [Pseudonocardiaceae bacterium]|nr:hypothetical protein [Pseudonocardiaceae bacterium]
MGALISVVILILLIGGGAVYYFQSRQASQQREQRDLDDAKAEARRWVERLGGQVLNLVGTNDASKQALADAGERYTAAGSQLDSARTAAQCRLVTQTALEGLYYTRAARVAMGLDPGPDLPPVSGQGGAGSVTEDRNVNVEGHEYAVSPNPSDRTPHYYPGGQIAGRPVPQGWYSEPWWKSALIGGAWGLGSALLFSSLFSGMSGIASGAAWEQGYDTGHADAFAGDWGGGYTDAGYTDAGYSGGDWGGGDWGGGDWGGGDFGGGGDW